MQFYQNSEHVHNSKVMPHLGDPVSVANVKDIVDYVDQKSLATRMLV